MWKGKKKYDAVKVKCREGKEEKIVFAYPKPTVKGIKVLCKEPYIYIYHKKPKQPKYRFSLSHIAVKTSSINPNIGINKK